MYESESYEKVPMERTIARVRIATFALQAVGCVAIIVLGIYQVTQGSVLWGLVLAIVGPIVWFVVADLAVGLLGYPLGWNYLVDDEGRPFKYKKVRTR